MTEQKYWKLTDDPAFSKMVWEGKDTSDFEHGEAVLIDDVVIWARMGTDLKPSRFKLIDSLKRSKWDKNHWAISTAIRLYDPQNGILDPIENRNFDNEIESALDMTGGYLLWDFQLQLLSQLTNICNHSFVSIRKAFNRRSEDLLAELDQIKICKKLSLWEIYKIRGNRGIYPTPCWNGANKVIDSNVL